MLRIHFTADDLTRIRIMDSPDPLWEVLLSLHLLQTRHGALVFDSWRQRTRRSLPSSTRLLTTLAPPKGYSPDFLTPTPGAAELEAGLDSLLATPRGRLRADLSYLAMHQRLPSWVTGLADGDTDTLRKLAKAVRRYFGVALAPYWATISASVRTDRSARGRAAVDFGYERVLDTLHDAVRWRAPVLEVDYPVEQEQHLAGRGLTLVPSFFCWRKPIGLRELTGQPVLVYPVERDADWALTETGEVQAPREGSLGELLGRTRSAVLAAVADTPYLTTTELARVVGISVAGASQHATVLRNADLIATYRHSGAAKHVLRPRGAALLDSPSY